MSSDARIEISSPAEEAWKYEEIGGCRICGNTNLEPVIDLGMQTLTGVFPRTVDEYVPEGPLELVRCGAGGNTCGLVQLKHIFPKSRLYGHGYGYRSGLNQSMVDHLRQLVSRVRGLVALKAGDIVLDIGSNDGTLLSMYDEPDLVRIGIDPTAGKFRQYYQPGIRVVPQFFSKAQFDAEIAPGKAAVVTSISMFYDLEDPQSFMNQVRDVLAEDGIWVFEQSYLPAMLERNSYDTICHEHVEYYGFGPIAFMAKQSGLKILDVETNEANGGSFRIFAAKQTSTLTGNQQAVADFVAGEATYRLGSAATYAAFRERVSLHRTELVTLLDAMRQRGEKVLGYGASTKGNVLLQYCGITREQMACVAEVNPDKFGCFTPQARIPILSEQDAKLMNPDAFLVLPWHFRSFIVSRETRFVSDGHQLIFPLPAIDIVRNA